MKILFLSPASAPDYQADCVLLGLKQLYGRQVVDSPRVSYLYKDYGDLSELYGRGFSLYGLLEDQDCDRTDIVQKIQSHFFDLVVYGSIQRDQGFFELVSKHYFRHEIAYIDGEDQPHGLFRLANQGIYFKRELSAAHPGSIYPIHFAIPAEKIGTIRPLKKTQIVASSDPRDKSTYIYTTERDYYADYARSLFAVTMKKAGWDCLRHYEIWANGCIPWFLDIDQCPASSCVNLPRAELSEALSLMDRPREYWDSEPGHATWLSLWERIHLKFSRYFTTERLAQYFLETMERERLLATGEYVA